ncbi:MAG: hypothetical protein HQL90_14085, partial [Magnetococcales bacterium]|nr:hypothetical protein [Magnetococcales bacterium]
ALKGLGDARFADQSDGIVLVEFNEPSLSTQKESVMPENTPSQPATPPPPAQAEAADLAKAKQELEAKEAAFAEKEARFIRGLQEARTRESAAFVAGLVQDGRALPRHQAALVSFMSRITDEEQLCFAEEGKEVQISMRKWLKEFLAVSPRAVMYGEHVKPETQPGTAIIEVPPGYTVLPEQAEKFQQTTAYAEAHKVDFITAARAVERGAQ